MLFCTGVVEGGLAHTRDMFGVTVGSIQGSKCSLPTNFIETSAQRGQGRTRKDWRSKRQVKVCSLELTKFKMQ